MSDLVGRDCELPVNKTTLHKAKLHTDTHMHTYTDTESPLFLFVCFIDKTRTVKPQGRSHSWILSFTQDGPAVSTKTVQRALQVQLRLAVYKLTSWLGFQDQQSMLTSPEMPNPTQDAS